MRLFEIYPAHLNSSCNTLAENHWYKVSDIHFDYFVNRINNRKYWTENINASINWF